MKLLIILTTLLAGNLKEDRIKISKNYTIDSPKDFTVMVDNIYGFVEVVPSDDDNIYLELEIEISGTDLEIEKAKRELELGERYVDDSLILFTKAPFIKMHKWEGVSGFNMHRAPDYKFKYQYTLKVPKNIGVYAKTVEKGDVSIKNIDGIVKAANINGNVSIENARDVRDVSSINGDITIKFLEGPKVAVDFNTINGDFNFELPRNFSAKVYFDSMNGELYTSFDYKSLSPKVEKSEKNGTYKIGTKTGVEIGSGGPELTFKSINGSVYLKKSNAR